MSLTRCNLDVQGTRIGVLSHLYNASVATQNVNDIFADALNTMAAAGETVKGPCFATAPLFILLSLVYVKCDQLASGPHI